MIATSRDADGGNAAVLGSWRQIRSVTMRVLHPLFVHLHIALLLMAFITMYYWLFKGLATSIFENRIYSLARLNTTAGVVFVVLSMVVGIRDGLAGEVASFDSPLGKWLYVKAILATLIVLVYGAFLYASRKKPQYLQEDPTIMFWCLATQLVGLILVIAVTTIGTMVVYYPHALERLGG
jgi:uncharacterized membrane protein